VFLRPCGGMLCFIVQPCCLITVNLLLNCVLNVESMCVLNFIYALNHCICLFLTSVSVIMDGKFLYIVPITFSSKAVFFFLIMDFI